MSATILWWLLTGEWRWLLMGCMKATAQQSKWGILNWHISRCLISFFSKIQRITDSWFYCLLMAFICIWICSACSSIQIQLTYPANFDPTPLFQFLANYPCNWTLTYLALPAVISSLKWECCQPFCFLSNQPTQNLLLVKYGTVHAYNSILFCAAYKQ